MTSSAGNTPPIHADLLAWYDGNGVILPWRVRGAAAAPYPVWLSEIMLQQTTVAAVIPYFQSFTVRWPTVNALAAAPEADIMAAWAGLGYYARARNLIACAKAIAAGGWPNSAVALRALPGIGGYTAAAIAAIAFERSIVPVDGNVERILARLNAVETPLPAGRREIATAALALAPASRAGDFAQGLMDLGRLVCRPRVPDCPACPIAAQCTGRALGIAASLPVKAAKPVRPHRFGAVYVARRGDGALLVETRPAKGLLGGMDGFPGTPWTEAKLPPAPPLSAAWQAAGNVRHVFTHFMLTLEVYAGESAEPAPAGLRWAAPETQALPGLMRKVLAAAHAPAPPALPRTRRPTARPSGAAGSGAETP